MNEMATTKRVRILMLHGFTQSGDLFRAKVRALEKHLTKAFPQGVDFVYPTGPHLLRGADQPGFAGEPPSEGGADDDGSPAAYGWWTREPQPRPDFRTDRLRGLAAGLDAVAAALRADGPFDGAIGFSQGAAAAGMVASLLEPGRAAVFAAAAAEPGEEAVPFPDSFYKYPAGEDGGGGERELVHPPFKFVVAYAGFRALAPPYRPFYEPRARTPLLSVLGTSDTVVDEFRSVGLYEAFEGGEDNIVYHPGGHFVPASSRMYVMPVISFIQQQLKKSADGLDGEENK